VKLYLGSFVPWLTEEDFTQCIEMVGQNKTAMLITNAFDTDWSKQSDDFVRQAIEFFASHGITVERLDLREYFDKPVELETKVKNIGLIYVFGGNTFVLRRAFAQSGLDKLLPRLLAGGAVYGGFSAGSSVLAPTLRGIELDDDPNIIPEGYSQKIIWDGLNLIDFSIIPHFTPASSDRVKYLENLGIKFETLRDGEAIIMKDGNMTKISSNGSEPK
jgi:dipeptidase E